MLPLDVYLENEHELSTAAAVGQTVDGLKGTVGEKLMSRDVDTRVVINFHGVSIFYFVSVLFIGMPFYLSRLFAISHDSIVSSHPSGPPFFICPILFCSIPMSIPIASRVSLPTCHALT